MGDEDDGAAPPAPRPPPHTRCVLALDFRALKDFTYAVARSYVVFHHPLLRASTRSTASQHPSALAAASTWETPHVHVDDAGEHVFPGRCLYQYEIDTPGVAALPHALLSEPLVVEVWARKQTGGAMQDVKVGVGVIQLAHRFAQLVEGVKEQQEQRRRMHARAMGAHKGDAMAAGPHALHAAHARAENGTHAHTSEEEATSTPPAADERGAEWREERDEELHVAVVAFDDTLTCCRKIGAVRVHVRTAVVQVGDEAALPLVRSHVARAVQRVERTWSARGEQHAADATAARAEAARAAERVATLEQQVDERRDALRRAEDRALHEAHEASRKLLGVEEAQRAARAQLEDEQRRAHALKEQARSLRDRVDEAEREARALRSKASGDVAHLEQQRRALEERVYTLQRQLADARSAEQQAQHAAAVATASRGNSPMHATPTPPRQHTPVMMHHHNVAQPAQPPQTQQTPQEAQAQYHAQAHPQASPPSSLGGLSSVTSSPPRDALDVVAAFTSTASVAPPRRATLGGLGASPFTPHTSSAVTGAVGAHSTPPGTSSLGDARLLHDVLRDLAALRREREIAATSSPPVTGSPFSHIATPPHM